MPKRIICATIVFIALSLTAAAQQYYPVRNRMDVTSLDGTWMFRKESDKGWTNVTVPGNWETQGLKTPEYGRDLSLVRATCKRTFMYKEEWNGRDVILRLDGIRNGYTAYINGHLADEGHSAFTMRQTNITSFLRQGENEIRIEVSSHSPYWLFDVCDAWSLTGITRSVELFSVPRQGSIADVVFVSKVNMDNSADISVNVTTNGVSGHVYYAQISLADERLNHVVELQGSATVTEQGTARFLFSGPMKSPRLWTAETPNLYRLQVKLFDGSGKQLQSVEEKVGIREVRVENRKILLNNREIFLRGACLSENDAIEGSAMSYHNRRLQLEQMKRANINFIRTAHYPLDYIFTRMCDEMGFYVCDEIPFASRGDEYLKNDGNVVAELKARAKATIDRDRNNPSVILWSHGNENNIYPCQDSVLQFTKMYDPTRLRCVPQAKGAFLAYMEQPSMFVDVLSGHYLNDGVLEKVGGKSALPLINTEYAHSAGTAFGELEHKYGIFRRKPYIAGGSVWSYQDQSILTHNFNQQTQTLKGVRVDSLRYIDCYGLTSLPEGRKEINKEGTDGVVYGDGYPQEDYFELAQVYTPVGIDVKNVSPEKTSLEVENHFDFITLHGYRIEWQLMNLQQIVASGISYLSAPARGKEQVDIYYTFSKEELELNDLELMMRVVRPDGSLCYEKSTTVGKTADYKQLITDSQGEGTDKCFGVFGEGLLKNGLLLRVGRPVTMGLDQRRTGLWPVYIVKPSKVKVKRTNDGYSLQCRWVNPQDEQNFFVGNIHIATDRQGTVDMTYSISPSDSIKGHFYDLGITFSLPIEYTDVKWIGKGPFSHTPDKTEYNHRAVWQLNKDDLRFYGNRGEADILGVFTEDASHQLTLASDGGNMMLENIGGSIHLTDEIYVGTYGTKFKGPQKLELEKGAKFKGRIVLKYNAFDVNAQVFGAFSPAVKENPYMESYGK